MLLTPTSAVHRKRKRQLLLKTLFNSKLKNYYLNKAATTVRSLLLFRLMDPAAEVAYEIGEYVRVYKDGRVERHSDTEFVPPSLDSLTRVQSKDVMINQQTDLSARLYLPKNTTPDRKLPLLVYIHGGRFSIESAFSPMFHRYLNLLVAEANVVAVSVNYRLAPENPIPAAYEDSWAALEWVGVHSKGEGPEDWLNQYVDFGRVFVAGDSAGGNISHNMAIRAGLRGLDIYGIGLIHPYFWGKELIGSEVEHEDRALVDRVWAFVCPSCPNNDDPRVNPFVDGAPKLSGLGCSRVFICVAEKDILRDRGWLYYEKLKKSGWTGDVEIVETQGEGHIFHERNPDSDKAKELIKRLATFFNS